MRMGDVHNNGIGVNYDKGDYDEMENDYNGINNKHFNKSSLNEYKVT